MPVNRNPESASNSMQEDPSKAQDSGPLEDLARYLAEGFSISHMPGFRPAIFDHLRVCEKLQSASYHTFSVEAEDEQIPCRDGKISYRILAVNTSSVIIRKVDGHISCEASGGGSSIRSMPESNKELSKIKAVNSLGEMER